MCLPDLRYGLWCHPQRQLQQVHIGGQELRTAGYLHGQRKCKQFELSKLFFVISWETIDYGEHFKYLLAIKYSAVQKVKIGGQHLHAYGRLELKNNEMYAIYRSIWFLMFRAAQLGDVHQQRTPAAGISSLSSIFLHIVHLCQRK